ncbi:site-specific DNA-methyltransferase [Finegoldia magna]|uniref:site-specific DNA-methyltransferase n=1 Tax=Finegoldia magna TaxID=1260 RepID=UPI0007942678|nr:site-specific DNA-methyltransferase [Finegoldia magna]KXA07042.1 DNA (cytosine-5-)-methyltransferase [Finegoldia magna]
MDKLNMQTQNLAEDKFKKLQELFPNAVTEVMNENGEIEKAIDKDVLMQEISSKVVEGREERYQFTWPDKKQSILAANAPISKTLRPCRAESKNFDTTENLYIEGDNLEVLKLLQETYLGKIKMIYIDPPYNTGNDFVYNDDFKQTTDGYLEDSGQYDDEGNRLEVNLESNGRFHTDWLNMIYPRLKLARDLLSDDGVITISIDDNEVSNLKKICIDLFGEDNVETAIWNKEAEGSSGTLKQIFTFRRIHEYIIFAYKNRKNTQFYKINEALKGRENDFQTANLAVNLANEKKDHVNYFTITNPSGDTFTRQWKWSKERIEELIEEDLIFWGSDGRKQPRLIVPTDERRKTFLLSILNYGGTTVGRKDFELLMGKDIEFSYPKPVILLKKIINSITNSNDIILDFFSGSATTADAVMQLNAEDGGNRKFIMVQLPEQTDEKSEAYKAGYKNICEIGKERIRRAGEKILEENKDKENIDKLDVGFRVLKTDSSNMKDVYYTPEDTEQSFLDNLENNIEEDRTQEDLLFQVMLDLGVPLSSTIEVEQIEDAKVYKVEDRFLVACFDGSISDEVVKQIADMKPFYAVFRDMSMKNDSVAVNFEQIFESVSPETIRKVL